MERLSFAVMAHESRARFVEGLLPQLPPGTPVVWDRFGDRWETGRRALLAAHPASDRHVIVQDDAVLCRNFVQGAAAAACHAGDQPVAFYCGNARPLRGIFDNLVQRARARGNSWVQEQGPYWGVSVAIPTHHIVDLVEWGDAHEDVTPNFDIRMAAWYRQKRKKCLYTMPSLVDHRPIHENPSLVEGRTANRQARWFIGDRDPLDIDWSKKPKLKMQYRHRPTGSITTAAWDSPLERWLAGNADWEQCGKPRELVT